MNEGMTACMNQSMKKQPTYINLATGGLQAEIKRNFQVFPKPQGP